MIFQSIFFFFASLREVKANSAFSLFFRFLGKESAAMASSLERHTSFSELAVSKFTTRTSSSEPCKHLLYIRACKFEKELVVLLAACCSKVAVPAPNKAFVGHSYLLVKHAIGFVSEAKVHFCAEVVQLFQAPELKVASALHKVSSVHVDTKLKATTV